jgi:membrane-associated HD superfamily phosphohydrolase
MGTHLAKRSTGQRVLLALLLLASVALAWSATALPLFSSSITPKLQEGRVADRDYRAPERISYVSQVLTEQRRDAAARAISPIYTSPDARVARKQLESLRNVLAYISDVRADAYATPDQKLSDLSAMEDFQLDQSTALTILGMNDTRWQAIQQETIVVLEKVMSNAIRPEDLADAYNRVPALVSLTLPEEQAGVVAKLAAAFVAPNSFYSQDLTQAAQDQARAAVEPVTRSFVAGQTIVFRGEVLDAADTEALQQLGFIQPEQIWPDLTRISILVLVLAVYMVLFFHRDRIDQERNRRAVPLVALLFIVFLFGARLIIPSHTVLPYAFPVAAYSLTVAALYGSRYPY